MTKTPPGATTTRKINKLLLDNSAHGMSATQAPRHAADPTYSFEGWELATRSGAALLWRAPTGLGLPIVKVLGDGTYLSVLINPAIRGARRRAAILTAAGEIANASTNVEVAELDPTEAHLVRVVEYDVPDREGNGTGELIVLLTTILDSVAARADELAAAYHQRWGATRGRACRVNAQIGGRLCRVRSS